MAAAPDVMMNVMHESIQMDNLADSKRHIEVLYGRGLPITSATYILSPTSTVLVPVRTGTRNAITQYVGRAVRTSTPTPINTCRTYVLPSTCTVLVRYK